MKVGRQREAGMQGGLRSLEGGECMRSRAPWNLTFTLMCMRLGE